MSCTFTEYPAVGNIATGAVSPLVGSAVNKTGPALVVSNHPETIDLGIFTKPQNLYKCQIPLLANTTKRVRVFMWHVASTDNDGDTFRLKLKLGSGTGSVSNSVKYVEAVPVAISIHMAKCLSRAIHYGIGYSTGNTPSLSTSEVELWSLNVDEKLLSGSHLRVRGDCLARYRSVRSNHGRESGSVAGADCNN